MAELVIIRGLPGSGKSTMAKKEFPNHLHYEADHLFCDTNGKYRFDMQLWHEACQFIKHLTDFALARGENVVISDVFCTQNSVAGLRSLAEAHNAEFSIITCDGQYGNIHGVPVKVLTDMERHFEDQNDWKWK